MVDILKEKGERAGRAAYFMPSLSKDVWASELHRDELISALTGLLDGDDGNSAALCLANMDADSSEALAALNGTSQIERSSQEESYTSEDDRVGAELCRAYALAELAGPSEAKAAVESLLKKTGACLTDAPVAFVTVMYLAPRMDKDLLPHVIEGVSSSDPEIVLGSLSFCVFLGKQVSDAQKDVLAIVSSEGGSVTIKQLGILALGMLGDKDAGKELGEMAKGAAADFGELMLEMQSCIESFQ
jgi:hypothetical protein